VIAVRQLAANQVGEGLAAADLEVTVRRVHLACDLLHRVVQLVVAE
jgi:hypothetical protein